MILGYILVGVITGFIALVTTIVLGGSFLSALLAYMAVGATTTVLVPAISYVLHRLSGSEDDEAMAGTAETAAGDGGATAQGLAQSGVAPAFGGMAILAVDDDPFIRELIPKIAAKAGFPDVTTADSAEAALRVLSGSQGRFGCVLLDIHMPGTDGIELCARIRRIPGYRKTPVIMLTAMADEGHLERAFKAGATDYTTKPFDVIEFAERLKAAEASRPADRTAVAAEAAHAADRMLPPDAVAETGMDRSDPERIEGVANFIELAALSNYLTRLSGRKLVRSTVVVVQTVDVESLQARLPGHAFQRLFEEIAGTIDDVFAPDGYVGAYAGRGQFVLLCDWSAIARPSNREADLQYHADRKTIGRSLGLSAPVELVMGAPVRPRTARKDRARDAIGTAMDLADLRAAGASGTGSRYSTEIG